MELQLEYRRVKLMVSGQKSGYLRTLRIVLISPRALIISIVYNLMK